jgi:hypothetical protein
MQIGHGSPLVRQAGGCLGTQDYVAFFQRIKSGGDLERDGSSGSKTPEPSEGVGNFSIIGQI